MDPNENKSFQNNKHNGKKPYFKRHRGHGFHNQKSENANGGVTNAEAITEGTSSASAPAEHKNADFKDRRHQGRQKNHKPHFQKPQSNGEETRHIDDIATVCTVANDYNNVFECAACDFSDNASESDEKAETSPALQEDSAEPVEVIGVHFRDNGKIYFFDPCGLKVKKDQPVIVETARGMEYGICALSNTLTPAKNIVQPFRKIMRLASERDTERFNENIAKEKEALVICQKKIEEHDIQMSLVDVEYTFDNSNLLFYFTADMRVDFRDIVIDLASVFHTRIELRQIGIRDEAKIVGGLGICGRPLCCKTFLYDFSQVSIKMAKEQNLSLNSAKISGTCGRLMCCLKFEHEIYDEEIRKTPKVDSIVKTPDGEGVIIETSPLTGIVKVKFKDPQKSPKAFHRDSVTVIGHLDSKPGAKDSDGDEDLKNLED
ncbi:MAG: stage 0 sporulation family protein [Clostridia bacterium]|nr:stage 0 sporulation family protein [Clostridia bacterium]